MVYLSKQEASIVCCVPNLVEFTELCVHEHVSPEEKSAGAPLVTCRSQTVAASQFSSDCVMLQIAVGMSHIW